MGIQSQTIKYRIIEEKTLLDLLASSLRLRALEADGVDNWSWYGEGFREFLEYYKTPEDKDNEDFWFEDAALVELENYKPVTIINFTEEETQNGEN